MLVQLAEGDEKQASGMQAMNTIVSQLALASQGSAFIFKECGSPQHSAKTIGYFKRRAKLLRRLAERSKV